jgi:hypothetical protein
MEPRGKGPRSPMRRQLAPTHPPGVDGTAPAVRHAGGRIDCPVALDGVLVVDDVRSWILHSSRPSILSAKQCRHPPFSLRRYPGHHALWLGLTMPCASSLAGEPWTVTTSPFRMIYSFRNPSAMLTVSKKTAGGTYTANHRARARSGGHASGGGGAGTMTEPGDSPREG